VKVTYEKGKIVIRIPVTEESAKAAPISKSGKSRMVASTGGFATVDGAPDGVRIGLNVIAKV